MCRTYELSNEIRLSALPWLLKGCEQAAQEGGPRLPSGEHKWPFDLSSDLRDEDAQDYLQDPSLGLAELFHSRGCGKRERSEQNAAA